MFTKKGFHLVLPLMLSIALQTMYSCEARTETKTTMNQDAILPFGLKLDADPDFKGGYTIREADGLALVGKGVAYRDIDLEVTALVGYGVKEEILAAEVLDAEGRSKFIKIVKSKAPSKQPFTVSWSNVSVVKQSGTYTWVDLAAGK